jgi:heptosyltransferase I
MSRRIGIVMLSAVGDAVHVLPVVTALKRHDPTVHITWILEPLPATLVRGHPDIDRVVTVEPRRGLAAFRALRHELGPAPFDLVLDLQVAFKAGLVTAAIRAETKIGFDRARSRDLNWLFTTARIPPHAGRQHVQDQYFEFLAALGVPAAPVVWDLGPWPGEPASPLAATNPHTAPYAALAIGASDPDREWAPDRWAAVIDALEKTYGLRPVLVGAGTDRDRRAAAAIRETLGRPVADTFGSGLRPLVAILHDASLVLSVDTGALHMTVALDRPVIALMSNADPRRTGPYRRFADLIVDAYHDPGEPADGPISWTRRPGRMPRIAVSDVLERLARWKRDYVAPVNPPETP